MSTFNLNVRRKVKIPLSGTLDAPTFVTFDGLDARDEHVALIFGEPSTFENSPPLVRIHSECLTGDVFSSRKCDCGPQLRYSIEEIGREGGILLYLRQEGRGIGLKAKIDAYDLQAKGHDTFTANLMLGHPEDGRDFSVAAKMLEALEVFSIKLLTNNPQKVAQLQAAGISVLETRNTPSFHTADNYNYLQAKRDRHGHMISQLDDGSFPTLL